MNDSSKIFVTKPFLPPLNDFLPYLEGIWSSGLITNSGPYHKELEEQLCNYLDVEHISLFSNCTIALITALQALRVSGEVITTPFSFVATSHSLLWNGIKPIFVDIDQDTFNLNPAKIESSITPQTTAILPVHCYGNPCDVEAIDKIAKKYNLKVIYDAAHAFGVKIHDRSLLSCGDLSVLSFHATKVFNTFEGGAIISPNYETKKRIDQLKNFGFEDEITVTSPGINGKMSEFNAAFGLYQLKHIDEVIQKRSLLDKAYRAGLEKINGVRVPNKINSLKPNYSYFPILIEPAYKKTRDELYQILKDKGVYARRYFYPLISNFPMYSGFTSSNINNLPIANKIANEILCLPLYPDLEINSIDTIVEIIKAN